VGFLVGSAMFSHSLDAEVFGARIFRASGPASFADAISFLLNQPLWTCASHKYSFYSIF
jgi:hypothetical protein